MLMVMGHALAITLFLGMLWRLACRWRYLAKFYAAPADEPLATRSMQSAVLLGLGAYNSVKGILNVGVHRQGVSMRIMAPFSLFHAPLFIPFSDISGWKTTWYLDAPSSELTIRKAPDVKIVVPAELAEWVQGYAGGAFTLNTTVHPDGRAGRGWHVFSVAAAIFGVFMVMTVVAVILMR